MASWTFYDTLRVLKERRNSEEDIELYRRNYAFFEKNRHIIAEDFDGYAAGMNDVLYIDTSLKHMQQMLDAVPGGLSEYAYIEQIIPKQ